MNQLLSKIDGVDALDNILVIGKSHVSKMLWTFDVRFLILVAENVFHSLFSAPPIMRDKAVHNIQ